MKKDRALLQTQPLHANHNTFLGTDNERYQRAIAALLKRPHWRKELDSIAGCANTPELISQLRKQGLDIRCVREIVIDRDGRKCRAGVYYLTSAAIRIVRSWLKRRELAK